MSDVNELEHTGMVSEYTHYHGNIKKDVCVYRSFKKPAVQKSYA